MATESLIQMFPVTDNRRLIAPVARTICHAFSQDPLIRWLRPTASPWSSMTSEVSKWQYRRIQQAIYDGYVLSSPSVKQLTESISRQSLDSKINISVVQSVSSIEDDDAGAVILLFPPKRYLKWTIKRSFLACKLWFLNIFDPAPDSGSSGARVDTLLTFHDQAMERVKARFGLEDIWYLEVLAVHPSLQSKGVGRKTMKWLLDHVGKDPMVLECTAESNVKFYEKWGFKVVEKVELVDEGQESGISLWVMYRPASSS